MNRRIGAALVRRMFSWGIAFLIGENFLEIGRA
jgi:hypothetical protein